MNYSLIDQDDQLADVCQKARQHAAVALDTEFVRTRTYYPQLGLIQLFDDQQLVLIDPLNIRDWSPFIALLTDTSVTKFLHAGGEDLEVFLHRFGVLPTPMIDTQILAAFSGQPLSWGFASMVAHFTQVELDKSESRTDWLARPLTQRQCEYAAADVHYLLPIARQLMINTEEAGNMAAPSVSAITCVSVVWIACRRMKPGGILPMPGSCVRVNWRRCSDWQPGV